jgi:hypothetical protein
MDLPDYHGGSIVNLMASLQMGLGGEAHDYPPLRQLLPAAIAHHRQVILWVIDGLGYDYLRAHPEAIHLNAALQGRITTVYPPTTASAITTFLTGDAPQQHGLTGWFVYFRELGAVLSVLPGKARYGGAAYGAGGVDVGLLLDHKPFTERIGVESYYFSPAHIVDSEFNQAHLGAAKSIGFQSLTDLCDRTVEIAHQPGQRYLYLYWPELDTIGHQAGIGSEEAGRHLQQLDQAFFQLCQSLQGSDTLLLVCADHGQIDTIPEQTLLLDDFAALSESLILPLCGEPRSAFCYLRSGREAIFDQMAPLLFKDQAAVYPSATLVEKNWFGLGQPHPCLMDRIGDRVLLMRQRAIIRDCLAQETPHPLVGVHGGLSRDELWVPLIFAHC